MLASTTQPGAPCSCTDGREGALFAGANPTPRHVEQEPLGMPWEPFQKVLMTKLDNKQPRRSGIM